jgi:hypothetical protein
VRAEPRPTTAADTPPRRVAGAALTALALAVSAFLAPPAAAVDDKDAEAEAAALAFVRENHPELADLLASLKPMRPDEYRKAVRDLSQVSRTLSQLRPRDPRRYELALAVWKTRSRVDLLTARLAATPPGPAPELERQIRQAVAAQVDAEIVLQRLDRDRARERLAKLEESLSSMEARRDSTAAARATNVIRRAEKARRGTAAEAKAPARRATKTTTTTNKTETQPDPSQDSKPGERQP